MDNMSELSSMIEKLMSDPSAMEMVQKLKQGTLSESVPAAESVSPMQENTSSSDSSKLLSSIAPLLNGINGNTEPSSPETKRRNQLLCALKPYLSRDRQELIDTLTSLSGMSGLIEMLKGGGRGTDGK
ncbi:MAG: hypothetical protein IKV40_07665 [Clostridia bacterium]|nr:hypothetical protein [Clostridia bacterium]